MKTDKVNPPSNKIPAGLNETSLLEAISSSGYPLQGLVAQTLVPDFGVTEEWGYIDRDTQEHRALDVFAFKRLSESSPVRPDLVILIECKRSRHPYIFFKSVPNRPIPDYPKVAGLYRNIVKIQDAKTRSYREVSCADALSLDTLKFVEPGPPKCAAFTKAIPKGKKVELSGTDPFNSLVLPLAKALDHAAGLFKETDSKTQWLSPTLILCVSVLDAPMLMVDDPKSPTTPTMVPWVRITRQEANPVDERKWFPWYRFYSVDAVHADFFDVYIKEHVLPFAQQYAERAIRKEEVLRYGGEVNSLEKWTWEEIRSLPQDQR